MFEHLLENKEAIYKKCYINRAYYENDQILNSAILVGRANDLLFMGCKYFIFFSIFPSLE